MLIRIDKLGSFEVVIVGDKSKDLILQTKGKVKIQYGNKFIDLYSTNSENALFYTREQIDEILKNL